MDPKLRLIIGLGAIFLFLIGSGTLAMLVLLGIASEWVFEIYVTSSDRIGPKPKLNEPKK